MADDVQDIAIYTGSEWTSLSELAAGVVDAKLPIESVDGTVKLDGASSVFTVSTGGDQACSVTRTDQDADQMVIGEHPPGLQGGSGSAGLHIQGVSAAEIKSTLNSTGHGSAAGGVFSYRNGGWTLRDRQSGGGFIFTINPSGNAASAMNALGIGGTEGQIRVGYTGTSVKPSITFYEDLDTGISRSADDEISFITGGDASLIVERNDVIAPVGIQTPSVRGLADNDAEVTLGSNFTVSTGGEERVNVSDSSITNRVNQVLQINKNATTAPNNAANVNNKQMMTLKSTDEVGAKFIGLSFQHVLSGGKGASACIGLQDESADGVPNKGEMQFVIRGDNSTQVKTPLKINKDAIIVEGQIQTPSVRGPAGTDAQVTLGGQATLKAGDGSEYVPTDSASIATKKTVDDKIWVGTTAEYLAIPIRDILPTTLYCLTD